ncbi:MAG: hypothetical protein WBC91_25835, partial [Phototrophicaceae bacterium]
MALVWQSSGFWFMLCTVLLLLVGCTVIKHRMTPSLVVTSDNLMPTPMIHSTFFPPPEFTIPLDITAFETRQAPFHISPHLPPDPAAALHPNIKIDDPTCYALANGGHSCIGKVWNYGNSAIGDTSIALPLSTDTPSEQRTITLEQRLIPEQSFAPYRLILDTDTHVVNNNLLFSPEIIQSLHPMAAMRTLPTSATDAGIIAGRYHLSVTVTNDTGFIAENIRLFTTLDTTEWGIVGYIVHEVENNLENGAMQVIDVEIIPLALPQAQHIMPVLHAEG